MDAAYIDKLDGKITEEFWRRKTDEWALEEQQLKLSIDGLAKPAASDRPLDAQRVFEFSNRAYLLYLSQDSAENPHSGA